MNPSISTALPSSILTIGCIFAAEISCRYAICCYSLILLSGFFCSEGLCPSDACFLCLSLTAQSSCLCSNAIPSAMYRTVDWFSAEWGSLGKNWIHQNLLFLFGHMMFHFPQVKQFMTFLDFRRPLFRHIFLQLFNLLPVIFISLSYLLISRFHVVINSGGPLSVRLLNICIVLFL